MLHALGTLAVTRVVFVQASNNASCLYYVCIMIASEMDHRCNILKMRP